MGEHREKECGFCRSAWFHGQHLSQFLEEVIGKAAMQNWAGVSQYNGC